MKKYKVRFEGERCSYTFFVKTCGDYHEAILIAWERIIHKYGYNYAVTVSDCISVCVLR